MKNFKFFVTLLTVLLFAAAAAFAGGGREAPEILDVDEEGAVSSIEGLNVIDREAGWELGQRGGSITLATTNDPRTFNDWVAAETSSTVVTGLMHSGMLRRNTHTLEFEPAMAEGWVVSDDELSVTFTLRPGLRFSDGTPITAHDFVFSAEIVQNEEVGSNARSSQLVGGEMAVWEALDDRRVRVSVSEVYAGLLTLSGLPPAPRHILEPIIEAEGFARMQSFWGIDADISTLVGSGPYMVAEYVPGQRIVMTRNPNYWESDEAGTQLPYLDEVVFSVVPDNDTALQRFLAGEIDIYGSGSSAFRGEDYAVLVDRQDELSIRLYEVGPAASTQFIVFNQNYDGPLDEYRLEWFNNRTFRQAMAHLVDRQTIIDNIAFGFGFPQYSFVPQFSPFYLDRSPELAFPYDPEAAADLLDSIGFVDQNGDGWRQDPEGNRISFTLQTNSDNSQRVGIGELFSQEAREIGIEITFRPGDFNAIVGQLVGSFDWEAIIIGLTGSVDPISGANVYPSSGNLHMIHPLQESPLRDWEQEVDDIWFGRHPTLNANYTLDEAVRTAGYHRLQEIWIEEVPWVFTFNPAVMVAAAADLGNVKPQPINGFEAVAIVPRMFRR